MRNRRDCRSSILMAGSAVRRAAYPDVKEGPNMRTLLALAATTALACAIPRSPADPLPIPVSVSSNNRSSVDVYLLCGDRDAQWLGVVAGKESRQFEVPSSRARCVQGLNFFLVHRELNRGYWVGPMRLRATSSVHLTIEKYAGLSIARVGDESR
jgi:hypothetical protein